MSSDLSAFPSNDPELSGLGRALLDTGGSNPSSGPWVPPTAKELGKLLPEYEIVKMLGRGGMGAVYMGRQISLERPVAIKILSNTLDEADASFAERFKNEARAMGKLNHPGIVSVYAFGETAGGLLYIVMEYVDGTDVARMITASGRLHTEHAMAITARVCDALAYAHERGIIHRDIKPANIMVAYDGSVKVADFGLAKVHGKSGETMGLTQSGMAMGTLHYMAPEVLMLGSAVDHRADIYAVGVMLYQMLTGKVPHGVFKLPSLQIPGLDPRYDGVIAKAIMEDREARYQRVVEMRRDLDGILTQPVLKVEADASHAPAALPTQARPQRPAGQPYRPPQRQVAAPRPLPSSNVMLMWAILAAALVAGGAWWLKHTAAPQPLVMRDSPALANPAPLAPKDGYTNSLGMKFVPVPGTSVLFGIHEVRYQDYAAYAGDALGVDDAWKDQSADGYTPTDKKEQHPVTKVSWEDAQKFCAWLSKKEGKTYRLPTDEEWSIAVGLNPEQRPAGTTPEMLSRTQKTKFPWEGDFPPKSGDKVGNYRNEGLNPETASSAADFLDNYVDGHPSTAPVMSFMPNQFGLYDMGGNVWEWYEDWSNAEQKQRVMRGGSWDCSNRNIMFSSYRNQQSPLRRYPTYGFRVVLVAPPTPLPPVSKPAPEITAASTPAPTSRPTPTASSSPSALTSIPQPVFTNTLGMKFVALPGTKTLMCIHETRNQDYSSYASSVTVDGRWANTTRKGLPIGHEADHPVLNMSWIGAKGFCDWLSKKEGHRYRLPTDREWSIAIGIAEKETDFEATTPEQKSALLTDTYPWGTDWPPPAGYGNVGDEAHEAVFHQSSIKGFRDGFAGTAPVMSFAPNQLGIYDLTGNIWEFCEDWYNDDKRYRVLRGSHFNDYKSKYLCSSYRASRSPEEFWSCDGFRVVIEDFSQATTTPSSISVAPVAASPTIWVDAKNRSLEAKFVRLEDSNVVLDIRGKKTPVPMASLSSASQQIARDLTNELESGVLRQATMDKPFVNSLGMRFVPVKGTRVLFCIHETRMKDYRDYAREERGVDQSWEDLISPGGYPVSRTGNHPVANVNWNDVQGFCKWLSDKEKRIYRLPADAEWSAAAGLEEEHSAGTNPAILGAAAAANPIYAWGTTWPPPRKFGNYADRSLAPLGPQNATLTDYDDGHGLAAPVMSYQPNALGIYDLSGNVWEWCEDEYSPGSPERVLRGGCWYDGAEPQEAIALNYRQHLAADIREGHMGRGFRVVIELP